MDGRAQLGDVTAAAALGQSSLAQEGPGTGGAFAGGSSDGGRAGHSGHGHGALYISGGLDGLAEGSDALDVLRPDGSGVAVACLLYTSDAADD